jgi:hypothetical protein
MRDMRAGSDNMHNYNEFVEEQDDVRFIHINFTVEKEIFIELTTGGRRHRAAQ